MPIDDLIEHEESTQCPCSPRIEILEEILVVHHALDCREMIEEAKAILVETKAGASQ